LYRKLPETLGHLYIYYRLRDRGNEGCSVHRTPKRIL